MAYSYLSERQPMKKLIIASLCVFAAFLLPITPPFKDVFGGNSSLEFLEPISQLENSLVAYPVAEYVFKDISGVSPEHLAWIYEAGIAEQDVYYVDFIMTKESNWRSDAINSIGCIGLGQNCPTNGVYWLKEACPNWRSDPVCQLKRFTLYASRYNGWEGSYNKWLSQNWW